MAPTLSFWDCGEFIACAYTLGIPHPPGTPFFVVIARFFTIFAPFGNIAARTNIISVISSAITCWLVYIVIIRVARRLPFSSEKSPSFLTQIGIRIAGLAGALILAFSDTFWFNGVETEVFAIAMLLMMLIIYLAIRWADEKENGGSDRLIILIGYLLLLSVGVHLTVLLLIPALFIFFVLVDNTKLKDILFWFTWGVLFAVVVPFYFFLGMIIPWFDSNGYLVWMTLMVLGLIFTGVMAFQKKIGNAVKSHLNYELAFALFAVGILGYSTHVYIPIRASQNPDINENDPSNYERFVSYLERKQYGQESMITRMFYRRGALSHQFGRYENMGFGGYFVDQYTPDSWGDGAGIVVIFIGVFGLIIGCYYAYRKFKPHPMLLIAIVFLLSSLGLLLYLNFSDGTRPDPDNPGSLIQLEVRDRDYFYTPAFTIYAVIIGLGMAWLLALFGEGKKFTGTEKDKSINLGAFSVLGLAFLVLPIYTVSAHYGWHDRSRDYVPEDYAHNILQSCRPNSILFTNGDNDTFPLWYLQEVDKVRKDIRIVNLSLLNTDWYILQLKHQMNINMYLEDDQIQWIPADHRGSIIYYRPAKKFYDRVRSVQRFLTPEQDPRSGQVMRVQDQMIEQIVIANMETPIYFAGSVPNSNRWTLQNYLIREGIVMRVDPDSTKPRYDLPLSDSLITKVYRYRGLDDIKAYKDKNNVGLTSTYPERFSELADTYMSQKDTTRAISILRDGIKIFPYYHQIYADLQQVYKMRGDSAAVDSMKILGLKNLTEVAERWRQIVLYKQFLGVFLYQNSMFDSALVWYQKAFDQAPDDNIAFRLLRDLYLQQAQVKQSQSLAEESKKYIRAARQVMEDWNNRHPEDKESRDYYNRIRSLLQG